MHEAGLQSSYKGREFGFKSGVSWVLFWKLGLLYILVWILGVLWVIRIQQTEAH